MLHVARIQSVRARLLVDMGDVAAGTGQAEDLTRPTFDAFFEDGWPRMAGLAALLVGDTALGAEIAQDVFGQVYRRWESIQNPDVYVKAAIRNEARSRLRRMSRHRLVPLEGQHAPASSDRAQQSVVRIDVQRALAILSPSHHEVIILRYYAGLSDSEIATATGMRLGTVKSRLHRALTALEKELT